MNKPITIIFCYARSGGTFLNKFLNNYGEFVVLSEAHPIHNKKGGKHSLKGQMKSWYDVDLESKEYMEQMQEIKRWCDENNKYLIIRDWSYIDFTKSYLNNDTPVNYSTNLKLLENTFDLNKFAYVRDTIDVCLSQGQKPNKFSDAYLSFVNYIFNMNIPIIKYENFCQDFKNTSQQILLNIGYTNKEKNIEENFSSKNVVGDIHFSRGNQANEILLLDRKFAFFYEIKEINSDKNIINANKLLNYSINYESRKSEDFIDFLKFQIGKLNYFFRKIQNKVFK